jgi:hypothetical protein
MGHLRNNQSGFSLVVVLAAIAALGAAMYYISDLLITQKKLATSAEQRTATRKYDNTLRAILGEPDICTCLLGIDASDSPHVPDANHLTFDRSDPDAEMNIKQLYTGCDMGSPQVPILQEGQMAESGLKVETIKLKDIINVSGSSYTGNVSIKWFHRSGFVAKAPLEYDIEFIIDPASPVNGTRIASCKASLATAASGGAVTSCPPGWVLIGFAGHRSAFCIEDPPTGGAVDFFTAHDSCFAKTFPGYGSANLCSLSEFVAACGQIGGSFVNTQVWLSDLITHRYGLRTNGGGGCDATDHKDFNDNYQYRCCLN